MERNRVRERYRLSERGKNILKAGFRIKQPGMINPHNASPPPSRSSLIPDSGRAECRFFPRILGVGWTTYEGSSPHVCWEWKVRQCFKFVISSL